MKAAPSSCRTWTKRIFSRRVRRASHDSVVTVAGEPEDDRDTPIDQAVDEQIGHGLGHRSELLGAVEPRRVRAPYLACGSARSGVTMASSLPRCGAGSRR